MVGLSPVRQPTPVDEVRERRADRNQLPERRRQPLALYTLEQDGQPRPECLQDLQPRQALSRASPALAFPRHRQPKPLERARNQIRCLIGPYHKDLAKLAEQEWIDRGKPDGCYRLRFDESLEVDDETIAAQTLRDYMNEYGRHADAKMLGSNGERCHSWTRGLLSHHHTTAIGLIRRS